MSPTGRRILNIPLNRVEGDLELHLEYDGNLTINSWSSGIMYRGFENILKGRGSRDGLVLTPRVCGICGTAHLMAAAQALDMLCGIAIPDNAVLVRNLALMSEHIQSDVRQAILMFMKDFVNPLYQGRPFFAEAKLRYEPFRGTSVITTIRETKKILEIVAIVGGQWPNSSFMVPGGIATTPSFNDMVSCKYLWKNFANWYEQQILGCSIERWSAVDSRTELDRWLEEDDSHRGSDLGLFILWARDTGLDTIGGGHRNFISAGLPRLPFEKNAPSDLLPLFAPGFISAGEKSEFLQARITEHVASSRFEGYGNGLHPFEGVTQPCVSDSNPDKYSWAKAPRYDDMPAETGPLAELLVAADPLFTDLVRDGGPSAFSRQLARFTRPARLLPIMQETIKAIDPKAPYYIPTGDIPDGRSYGIIEASRGMLGHWIEIRNGMIERYQIITPTAWNGSPRDANGIRGPWEEATVGIEVMDPENPVEIGHIVRSFDPCLACAVHRIMKR
jgi:uptake hydrogenase large subunit